VAAGAPATSLTQPLAMGGQAYEDFAG